MKSLLLLLLLAFNVHSYGQTKEDIAGLNKEGYQYFELVNKSDTIRYVIAGTKEEIKQKKPILLFRQGSMPIPLIVRYEDGYGIGLPFRAKLYRKEYHIVVIAKSGVPVVTDSASVSQFLQDRSYTHPFSTKKYLTNNHLDHYVRDSNRVLDHLLQQPWVDRKKVVVAGGSEGSEVATKLAVTNKNVTHLIYYSGNPIGRFDHLIRECRRKTIIGELTHEEGQRHIDSLYVYWKRINADPKATDKFFGDSYYAWTSFSEPLIDDLLSLTIPIFVAYGTRDYEMAEINDLLPLAFIAKGKTNLTLRPYLNCDHQFFELKTDNKGRAIDRIYRGDDLAKDFFSWLKTH